MLGSRCGVWRELVLEVRSEISRYSVFFFILFRYLVLIGVFFFVAVFLSEMY